MLKFLVRHYFHNIIYTDKPKLFYKQYQWICGLYILVSQMLLIGGIVFTAIGFLLEFFIADVFYSTFFMSIGIFLIFLKIIERMDYEIYGTRSPFEVASNYIVEFVRRFVSTHGKALGPDEWKKIKKYDEELYENLLSDECLHCCYFYSREIAKIIRDSTLIWGAVVDVLDEKHTYYAHAVILRNGYIYDSNLRESIKYDDYVELNKFIIYKEWRYSQYSQKRFRDKERLEYYEWCVENNVKDYQEF